jgi:SAM-dependent methyltransferase
MNGPADLDTAAGFARSWNSVGRTSVYSREQFLDWLAPLEPGAFRGKSVVELGFGNGSLLRHMADYQPARLLGVELGDTLETARRNLADVPAGVLDLRQGDLTQAALGEHDLAYCIGVLHHLAEPEAGFRAVLRHTRPGGAFHCWVYAREGNGWIVALVEPLRRVACRLPWWLTKHGLALPLVVPYFLYARALDALARRMPAFERLWGALPLAAYSRWIAPRPFWFFHHVAFDQLVARRTRYLRRSTIEAWLAHDEVEPGSGYLILRNGNSWKFGGRRRVSRSRA